MPSQKPPLPAPTLSDSRPLPRRSGDHLLEQTTERRGVEELPFQLPLPITERYHPELELPYDGSISIGTVTTGYLVGGKQLPLDGEHHRVTTTQRERGTNWGSSELIDALLTAAADVAEKHPGATMQIGNIAKGGGGDIFWSVSHNSGRDADIAFYLLDDQKRQPPLDNLVQVGSDGWTTAEPKLLFDPKRNWTLVKSFILNENIQLQYIFVSRPLRAKLLAHATKKKESPDLIAKAEALLVQPAGAAPHDDHFHIRLHCSVADLAEGCQEVGRALPTAETAANRVSERLPKLRKLLRSKDPEKRAGAAFMLALFGKREYSSDIARLLRDINSNVRIRATNALVTLRATEHTKGILGRLNEEHDPTVRTALVDALGQMGTVNAIAGLRNLIADQRPANRILGLATDYSDVGMEAARILALRGDRLAIPMILDRLKMATGDQTVALDHLLTHLTNQEVPGSQAETAARWVTWYDTARDDKYNDWVIGGFESAGYPVIALDERGAAPLLDAVLDERDHISHNARRALQTLAENDTDISHLSRQGAHRAMKRWYDKNRFRIEKEARKIAKREKSRDRNRKLAKNEPRKRGNTRTISD
ncbi:MAG: penicillin-insensitive murein endopeptidase [Myxococcales bacterium]|nr:penicillin-insensitive murein endopeptidase [Myxococcales bacterium]